MMEDPVIGMVASFTAIEGERANGGAGDRSQSLRGGDGHVDLSYIGARTGARPLGWIAEINPGPFAALKLR